MVTKLTSLANLISRLSNEHRSSLILLREIYLVQFMLKIVVILVMELFYAHYKSKLDQLGPNSSNQSTPVNLSIDVSAIKSRVESLRNSIIWSSPMRPELVVSSILMHSLYVSPLIPFHYLHQITNRFYDSSRYSLFKYLQNSSDSKQLIEQELDDIIEELIVSNSNYAGSLIRLKISHQIERRQMMMSDRVDNFKHYSAVSRHDNTTDDQGLNHIHSNNANNRADTNALQFIDGELRIIRQEYNYLQSLLYDKAYVWPYNRKDEAIRDLKEKWWRLNLSTLGNMTINNHLLVMFFMKTSAQFRSDHNIVQEFSLLRSLTHIDMYLVLLITNEYFARPLIDFVLAQMDMVLLINEFRLRVRLFQSKITKTIRADDEALVGKATDGQPCSRDECNRKCLHSYITLRLIMSHSLQLKLNGQAIILQLVFVVSTALCCALICMSQVSVSEHDSIKFLGLALMFVVNLFLICYAALNAYLLTIIKLIWSLLESAIIQTKPNQGASMDEFEDEQNHRDDSLPNIWTHKLQIANSANKSFLKSHDRYSNINASQSKQYSIISPHLLNLWQRLVHHDQDQLIKLFTCEIFDMPIDYHNLIKLNFWVTSLFMVYFAYKNNI